MGETPDSFSYNMRLLIILCVCLGLTAADPFLDFVKEHGKSYSTRAELVMRRAVFMENYEDMVAHNKRYLDGEETWWRKVTPYYDHTHEEWVAMFASGLPKYDNTTNFVDRIDDSYVEMMNSRVAGAAPDYWNWVEMGAVSSVKDQGQCGSCADFASVAIIESCFYQQRGVMFDDLSEQHLLDCAYEHYYYDGEGAWGAFGCDGAWPQAYLDWVVNENGGNVQTEESYPYEAVNGACRSSSDGVFPEAQVTGQYNRWNTNEVDMKEMVYINPVATSIAADYLGDYAGGVFNDPRCCEQISDPECKHWLNHEVTVVGYGTEGGLDYWLIKNSWTADFGENGYFKMKRGTGHCGVGALHYQAAHCEAK